MTKPLRQAKLRVLSQRLSHIFALKVIFYKKPKTLILILEIDNTFGSSTDFLHSNYLRQ